MHILDKKKIDFFKIFFEIRYWGIYFADSFGSSKIDQIKYFFLCKKLE